MNSNATPESCRERILVTNSRFFLSDSDVHFIGESPRGNRFLTANSTSSESSFSDLSMNSNAPPPHSTERIFLTNSRFPLSVLDAHFIAESPRKNRFLIANSTSSGSFFSVSSINSNAPPVHFDERIFLTNSLSAFNSLDAHLIAESQLSD